jgi:hypothetical protein
LVLAIGTPAPDGHGSALFNLREQAAAGARVAWVEHAAPAGCALDDRAAWGLANPALEAGLLHVDVLEAELALVPEVAFRCYRLGQWVEAVVAAWLPVGAWEACPRVEAPPAGSEVVLAVAGTWRSSVAMVGATGDGALFLAWASDVATDDQLADAVAAAVARWEVLDVVFAPRMRPNLVAALQADLEVTVWPNRVDVEVDSATEWRRAIIEGRVPHDHDPLLAEHVAASTARSTGDGSLRLVAPDDGRPVDAARAARMAWWRVVEIGTRLEAPAIY